MLAGLQTTSLIMLYENIDRKPETTRVMGFTTRMTRLSVKIWFRGSSSFLSPKRLSPRMTFATPLQLRVSLPLDKHCQGQHPSLNSEHEMHCSKRQRKQRRQRELCKWWSGMPVQSAKYPLRIRMRDSKSGFRVNTCQRGRCLQAISILRLLYSQPLRAAHDHLMCSIENIRLTP
jgi:hypothetical protein